MEEQDEYKKILFAFKLTAPESVRLRELLRRVKERNKYVNKTVIYRELAGLSPPDVLTKEEIEYFRKGKEK